MPRHKVTRHNDSRNTTRSTSSCTEYYRCIKGAQFQTVSLPLTSCVPCFCLLPAFLCSHMLSLSFTMMLLLQMGLARLRLRVPPDLIFNTDFQVHQVVYLRRQRTKEKLSEHFLCGFTLTRHRAHFQKGRSLQMEQASLKAFTQSRHFMLGRPLLKSKV